MNNKILIGSAAIKHWFSDFTREPKDIDYIGKKPKWTPNLGDKKVEYLKNVIFDNYEHSIILPNDLLTLKMSHLFWDVNWDKHMYDVQFLLKKGCKLDIDLFYKLYDYWNTIHTPNTRSKLDMSASDFFDNAIKCEYNHDFLHTLLITPPTYTKVLKDGAEVEVSEEKFNNLTHSEKCDLVYEEVMVMAYERYNKMKYKHAYSTMLKKFIISHAPLWEAIFIIENYIELHNPKFDYFSKIENELYKLKKK